MPEHSSVSATLACVSTVNNVSTGCLTDFLIATESLELIVRHGLNEKNSIGLLQPFLEVILENFFWHTTSESEMPRIQ